MAAQQTALGGRRRNPRGQGDRLRTELLDAAASMVAAEGNARGLSLSSVARNVGIAATSVYLHFSDIEQLKHGLVDRGYSEMNSRRAEATAGITDLGDIVLARWRNYAHFGIDNPGVYRLMFGSELPPAKAFDMPDSPGRQAFMDSVQSIARAQKAGRVTAADDPFLLTSLAWSAVHGLVALRIDRPNFPWTDLDAMINETLRRLLLISLFSAAAGPRRLSLPALSAAVST
jgi:AcrR family transcriptional regulator